MPENTSKIYARDMKQVSGWRAVLDGWRHSFLIQIGTFVFVITTILCVSQSFLFPVENNPRNVGGEKCDFPGLEQVIVTENGYPVRSVSVDEFARMTSADELLLIEAGQGSDQFQVYLPSGRVVAAYRYRTRGFDYGTFSINAVPIQGDGFDWEREEQVKLLQNEWRASYGSIISRGGLYQFDVDTLPGMTWCIELARRPKR